MVLGGEIYSESKVCEHGVSKNIQCPIHNPKNNSSHTTGKNIMPFIHVSPPTPDRLNAIPPQFSDRISIQQIRNLPDVLATPPYAYFRYKNEWVNIDRRGMSLAVEGQWKLLEARRITADTSFEKTVTVEEGIVTTSSIEREFAVDIGVEVGIPEIGLGASISTHLSEITRSSVEIRNAITTSTTISASTKLPEALFWFWQLDLRYVISGTKHFWHVTNNKDKQRLANPKDSIPVPTRDGEGRLLKNGRIPGAHPFKNEMFSDTLVVADQIFVTTQFPAAGVEVKMTNQDGEVTKLVDHRSPYDLDLEESSRPSRLLTVA